MRLSISAGKFKGTLLRVPQVASPVRSRVKMAVFSILGDRVIGASCLDLFAGSGNLGLEAISRGASSCDFVDQDYDSIKSINQNILDLNGKSNDFLNTEVYKSEVVKFVFSTSGHYDVIFMDPPYDSHLIHCMKNIHELIAKSGILVFFHKKGANSHINLNPNLKLLDSRNYGITRVDFMTLND